jgi:hypothetical protein
MGMIHVAARAMGEQGDSGRQDGGSGDGRVCRAGDDPDPVGTGGAKGAQPSQCSRLQRSMQVTSMLKPKKEVQSTMARVEVQPREFAKAKEPNRPRT